MKKMALFVFNGDPMCFIHVLLNALDMNEKSIEVKIIIVGAATKLIPELSKPENPLNNLWLKVTDAGLVEGACRACAHKMETLKAAEEQGTRLLDAMSGHPGMAGYQNNGFEIITF